MAEAARKRAEYAKLKIDMEVERTRINATLSALKEETEAETALTAAKFLEASAESEGSKADFWQSAPLYRQMYQNNALRTTSTHTSTPNRQES